jgi:hypothetical protein
MNVLQRRMTRVLLAASIVSSSSFGLTVPAASAAPLSAMSPQQGSLFAAPGDQVGAQSGFGDISGTPHAGAAGEPYEYRFTLDGVYGHLLTGVVLPKGLRIDQSGTLSGVLDPTLVGPQEIVLSSYVIPEHGDEWPEPIERSFTLEVEGWDVQGSPPTGRSGGTYKYQFDLVNAKGHGLVGAVLPKGLSIDDSGKLSGWLDPGLSGPQEIVLRSTLTPSDPARPFERRFTLNVDGWDVQGSPPRGKAGEPYSYQFTLGPMGGHWLVGAKLPKGLSISQSGRLSGVLDLSLSGPQQVILRSDMKPADPTRPFERSFTIDVDGWDVTGAPHEGFAGEAYEYQFEMINATGHRLVPVSVPSGLSIDETGRLSGVIDPALDGPQAIVLRSDLFSSDADHPLERTFTLEVDGRFRPSGAPPVLDPSEGQPDYHFHFDLGAYTRLTSPDLPQGLRLLPGGLLERIPGAVVANGRHTFRVVGHSPAVPRLGLPESVEVLISLEIADYTRTVQSTVPAEGRALVPAYHCPPDYPYLADGTNQFVNPNLRGLHFTPLPTKVRINIIKEIRDATDRVVGTEQFWVDNFHIHNQASVTFTWHCTSVADRGYQGFPASR